jgi:ribosomal protein S14
MESDRPHEAHPPEEEDNALESAQVQRNRYSQELAGVAPPGASPLPKAELVRKRGFVLSRISFRTIVMKKWKQSFWVQYGPHTMLWFRSRADFDDWLNNPYHNQSERNFLIKLAVNFVHDLYKPNVRGYQVTQCRTKGYGKKMVRQFKLERWMDYGPTIAAAFGSYNPKEVDDLREALVECMRNTPLNGGIRATGAVRQQHQQHQDQGMFVYK